MELGARQRLTPAHRLHHRGEFSHVFSHGVRHRCTPFMVVASVNTVDSARLGLAIAKRYASRAVERNRLKRQIREHFRLRCSGLPKVDCVVCLTAPTRTLSNADLRRALDGIWQGIERKCEASLSS